MGQLPGLTGEYVIARRLVPVAYQIYSSAHQNHDSSGRDADPQQVPHEVLNMLICPTSHLQILPFSPLKIISTPSSAITMLKINRSVRT